MVDKSSIKNKLEKENLLINLLKSISEYLKQKKVFLCLETDLQPKKFYNLISKFPKSNIKINYDIGNSSSSGYKFEEEFKLYSNYISVIHIKDRLKGGKSIMLGEGSVNFLKFFNMIKKNKMSHKLFIFQAYRDRYGINIFKKQLKWFKALVNLV